jgi:phytoene dehydrogenase-like protein
MHHLDTPVKAQFGSVDYLAYLSTAMAKRVAVIGGGLAGLTCAFKLARAGCATTVFDAGRRTGGRASSRSVEYHGQSITFNHGAQCLFVPAEQALEQADAVATDLQVECRRDTELRVGSKSNSHDQDSKVLRAFLHSDCL